MNISDDKKRQIWAACDAVNESGVKVTMGLVRDHMGGGSLSYISPVLREWKEAQRPKLVISEDLPEEAELAAERNVRLIAQDFATVYKQLFDDELVKATADLEARLKAANEQNEELKQYSSELEQQCTDQLEDIRIKGQQADSLNAKIEQLKSQLNDSEIAEKSSEINTLKTEAMKQGTVISGLQSRVDDRCITIANLEEKNKLLTGEKEAKIKELASVMAQLEAEREKAKTTQKR